MGSVNWGSMLDHIDLFKILNSNLGGIFCPKFKIFETSIQ